MSELDVWKQLANDVAQGNLKLKVHREGLDAAVNHLQTYIHGLDHLNNHIDVVSTVTGFGGFQIGVQLAQKFADKGGGHESIKQRLQELRDEAKSIQETLQKAATAYAETDQEFADVLTKKVQP